MSPMALSVLVGLSASFLATTVSLATLFVAQSFRVRVQSAIASIFTLPLVMPPTVLGYYLLVLVGPNTALGRLYESATGHSLAFSRAGVVVAATITALPIVYQALSTALTSVPKEHVENAWVLGHSPLRTLFLVQLPLARTGMLSACTLGFMRAVGDFGATMMFAGSLPGRTQTAALALYDDFLAGDLEGASSRARIMLLMGFVAVFLVGTLRRKSS
jgi:molybdate transport system permease protein